MSEGEPVTREWRFYVRDTIEFRERVLSCTEGLDRSTFVADERT